jgi:hypothetical protein
MYPFPHPNSPRHEPDQLPRHRAAGPSGLRTDDSDRIRGPRYEPDLQCAIAGGAGLDLKARGPEGQRTDDADTGAWMDMEAPRPAAEVSFTAVPLENGLGRPEPTYRWTEHPGPRHPPGPGRARSRRVTRTSG